MALNYRTGKWRKLQDQKMEDNYRTRKWQKITGPANGGKCITRKWLPWKMTGWKVTDLENGGKLQVQKMAENVKFENVCP